MVNTWVRLSHEFLIKRGGSVPKDPLLGARFRSPPYNRPSLAWMLSPILLTAQAPSISCPTVLPSGTIQPLNAGVWSLHPPTKRRSVMSVSDHCKVCLCVRSSAILMCDPEHNRKEGFSHLQRHCFERRQATDMGRPSSDSITWATRRPASTLWFIITCFD